MNGIIDIRGVEFSYPDGRKVLHGVDLEIGAGERVAILGPNGAGKTTLALHLNGILQPRAGTITVSGVPVVEDHYREVRRMVGLVFQDPNDQLFMPT
ncbi:MAG: ATP-binding cassette domain-containing protein, partial [Gemmatimonadota bacterium]